MARNGSARARDRGLIARPAQHARRQFAVRPPRRTTNQYGLTKLGDYQPRKVRAEWQADAFTYYESLPAIGYVLDHVANTVSACQLRLVEEDPRKGQIPSDDDTADGVLRSLVGPRGGLKEVLRRGSLLLQIIGEAFLVGTPVEGEVDAIFWEFLSTEEIVVPSQPGEKYRRNATGNDKEELPTEAYFARLWRSDARFSARASCGLRRCLDTCRELMLLGQMTEAIISTRLPMGLLLIPDNMTWHSPLHRIDETSTGDDGEVGDEPDFMDDLLVHMGAPIRDFSSAASLVPIVVEANAEDLKSVRVVELAKDLDTYAKSLRDEMHSRLAIGLDVPPEILTGKGMTNHWSAWNIDSDLLTKHVQPLGDLVADFLTYAFLRPMLEIGGMGAEEAARFTLLFDVSPIMSKADDDQKAMVLWDKGLLSDQAVIEKQGWDPDEVMPDKKESARRLLRQILMEGVLRLSEDGLKLLDLDPKWFDEATPPPPPPQADQPVVLGPDGQPIPTDGQPPPPADGEEDGPPMPRSRSRRGRNPRVDAPDEDSPDSQSGQDEPEPPARRRGRRGQNESVGVVTLVAQLAGRVDGAYDRAIERAGARVVSHSKRVPAFSGRFAQCRTGQVLERTTPADLAALRMSTEALLDDAWTELGGIARYWLRDHLESTGVDPRDADDRARRCAERLVRDVNAFTIANLHDRVPFGPDGLRVPASLVADAIAEAVDPELEGVR